MNDDRTGHAARPVGAAARCKTSPPRRILVVDDDEDICRFSTEVLIRSSCQLDTVEDAAVRETLRPNRDHFLIPKSTNEQNAQHYEQTQ